MRKYLLPALLSFAVFLLAACASPLNPIVVEIATAEVPVELSASEVQNRAISSGFSVSGHYYQDGAFNRAYSTYDTAFTDTTADSNIDTGAWLVVSFSSPLAASNLPASIDDVDDYPLKITRNRDGQTVLARFMLRNNGTELVVRPVERHWLEPLSGAEGSKTSWQGLKPATAYTVTLQAIRDQSGRILGGEGTSWAFNTIDVSWGLYFMSKQQPDGFVYTEKYIPGRDNLYFDPSAKTITYTHGYEKNASINDYRRENMLYFITKGSGDIPLGHDTLQYMIDDGWNFGVFYWDQFADEPDEVKNAEAKIWNVNNGVKGMRYRVQTSPGNGEYRTANQPLRPLGEEFYQVYVSAMAGNTANKRIIGHSTGAQLAAYLVKKVSDSVSNGSISASYTPSRLALLEGFWSNGSKSYFRGVLGWTSSMYNGAAIRSIVSTLKSRHPAMAIEQEKHQNNMCGDSWLSIGDSNYDLRKMTCVTYVYPDFIGNNAMNDTGDRHCYARLYYFWTYAPAVSSAIEASGGVTSRSSDSLIRSRMNSGSSLYVHKQVGGRASATPADDTYSRVKLTKY
ncbi:MAG: Ig-like domain-containing protein [Spirochaetes bacterium]|nr:Ig-like domain-containing protein [Spirochaetota bacterium]MBU0956781.1 Ig-like domain-containing protein [Spirochaetota bacterium]